MKKAKSYTLSEEAIKKLEALAKKYGRSKSDTLDRLILKA